MQAMFGIMKKLKQNIRIVAKRQSDGGKRLDIESENGAVIAHTQLVASAEDNIPYFKPFLGDRFMRDVGAAFAG